MFYGMQYAIRDVNERRNPRVNIVTTLRGKQPTMERSEKSMSAFKVFVGILFTFLLTAANVMAYEVVIHNYTDVPMEVTPVGENWAGGYDSGSCTVYANKEHNKCSLSPIGVCFQRVKWKWDDNTSANGTVKAGTHDDHPGGSLPACYNVYYEIRYNYNKTALSFERKY